MKIVHEYPTRREQDTLDFIILFIKNNSFPPTVREIARGLKLNSPATVQTYVNNLEKKKYISKYKKGARTIKVLKGVD